MAEHGDLLNPAEQVILLEACRVKDRLDRLDALVRGDSTAYATAGDLVLTVENPERHARQAAALFAQLVAALRLPDPETGRRPRRSPAKGAYLK